jgi:hypothetical protein
LIRPYLKKKKKKSQKRVSRLAEDEGPYWGKKKKIRTQRTPKEYPQGRQQPGVTARRSVTHSRTMHQGGSNMPGRA